jgi:hypothetical protein
VNRTATPTPNEYFEDIENEKDLSIHIVETKKGKFEPGSSRINMRTRSKTRSGRSRKTRSGRSRKARRSSDRKSHCDQTPSVSWMHCDRVSALTAQARASRHRKAGVLQSSFLIRRSRHLSASQTSVRPVPLHGSWRRLCVALARQSRPAVAARLRAALGPIV